MVTIAEYYASGQIETFDDEILLAMWESLSTEVQRQRWEMGVIEMVLQHRMQENNAKKLLSTTLTVELGSPGYDPAVLRTLAEHIPPGTFNKGFTPAHEETVVRQVPDKFDMRTINSWKSYGQHIVDVIDAAEIPETRRISIKHKNTAKHDKKGEENAF
jgi:hypothetical protein